MQIDGNTFVDLITTPADVSVVDVDHSRYLHSNVNRRYFTGQLENNVFVDSNPPAGSNVTAVQIGMNAVNSQGQSEAADPYELSLTGAVAPVPRISTKSGPFSPGEWLEFLPRSARGY